MFCREFCYGIFIVTHGDETQKGVVLNCEKSI